jgi:hypothetical protein
VDGCAVIGRDHRGRFLPKSEFDAWFILQFGVGMPLNIRDVALKAWCARDEEIGRLRTEYEELFRDASIWRNRAIDADQEIRRLMEQR